MTRQFLWIFAIIAIMRLSKSAPIDDADIVLATTTPEPPVSIVNYNYEPKENGALYSYRASNGVSREETVQITNEGTPEQDVIISGKYLFTADDGYRYVVKYSYDKNGSNVIIDQFPVRRIPPNALKSLIG